MKMISRNQNPNQNESRKRLISLVTHQHRLRHLKSIAARNLLLPKSIDVSDVSQVQTYFTLHSDVHGAAFYRSEVIQGSMNPNFQSFDLSLMEDEVNTASSYFVIRLWGGQQDQYKLIIEWIVDLSGLTYLGDQIHKDDCKYKPNSLVYGMFDAYFGAMDEKMVLEPSGSVDGEVDNFKTSVCVDQASVRSSYSVNSLSRIMTVLRAIKQTQATVRRVHHSIEDKLLKSTTRSAMLAEQEMLLLRVQQARRDLEWQTNRLQKEKEKLERKQVNNHQTDIDIRKRRDALKRDKDRLHEKKKNFFECREKYIKTNAQLFLRRKQLITDLAVIYPISETNDHKFTICGVHLPNADELQDVDDTQISVALGYSTHLVLMICNILDVRSRYLMEYYVSRSYILDHIKDKIRDSNREFPLFNCRKERNHFNHGVLLLNKNIAQLRDYCGLGTKDLRLTLPNLKSFLELRLGVKFDLQLGSVRKTLLCDRALLQRFSRVNPSKPSRVASRVSNPPGGTTAHDDLMIQEVGKILNEANADSYSGNQRLVNSGKPARDEVFKAGEEDDFFKPKSKLFSESTGEASGSVRSNDWQLSSAVEMNCAENGAGLEKFSSGVANTALETSNGTMEEEREDEEGGLGARRPLLLSGSRLEEDFGFRFKTWHSNPIFAAAIDTATAIDVAPVIEGSTGSSRSSAGGSFEDLNRTLLARPSMLCANADTDVTCCLDVCDVTDDITQRVQALSAGLGSFKMAVHVTAPSETDCARDQGLSD